MHDRLRPLRRRLPPVLGLILVGLLTGCNSTDDNKSLAAKKRGSKRPAAPVAVVKPVRGAISSFYTTTCTLEAEKTASIEARVTGVIKSIAHEEGDAIRAGQVLLQIENDEYRFRVEQLATDTKRKKDRYLRLKDMVDKKLIGFEELEEAKYDLKDAETAESLARLELSYTAVRAPFAGRLVGRTVDIGQTVKPATVLFELADLDPLLARVYVPSKTFKQIVPDQPVELVLDSDGTRLAGKIKLVSPVIDPRSGTIKVTIEVTDYPEGTRPGDFAQAKIVTERRDDAILIPRIAVVDSPKERFVFLVKDGKAIRKVVDVGFEENGKIEVLSGLDMQDRVVIKGQNALKDQAAIKVLEDAGA